MAAADVSKSTQHVLEDLVLNEGVKGFFSKKNVDLDFGAINDNAKGSADVAITGVAVGDVAIVNFRADAPTGLSILSVTTAADKVTVTLSNESGGNIADPAAIKVDVVVFDLT